MAAVNDSSVALVVTSPPYFAAKEYELALGEGAIPSSYTEYLAMLRDVFAECVRVLEPGGRMAVNVANLGRKPYRSLSADVVRILQDDLGLLLRGEIVWVKAEGANGSCAWGSYGSSANPAIRDVTERIVLASKGRFDRAVSRAKRATRGLPHESTITPEEFRALTLDVWRFPPASARRIGHPAPFPVELPRRLIELLTYRGDTVLDPFMGSGQVAWPPSRATAATSATTPTPTTSPSPPAASPTPTQLATIRAFSVSDAPYGPAGESGGVGGDDFGEAVGVFEGEHVTGAAEHLELGVGDGGGEGGGERRRHQPVA